ncbi:unnamed protein product [Lymnaea stagnalis]|uniref:DALR anticodon binding domain-containing protein n=1 Tax=Lymnaea stagnalis TaxID=6523 RepID=A0AAV2H4F3_LYMST
MMAEDSLFGNVINVIERNVTDALRRKGIKNERKSIEVRKKSRDLKSGDIILPAGSIKLNDVTKENFLASVQESFVGNECFISKVVQDQHSLLSFYLDRPKFCKAVLSQVDKSGVKYGIRKKEAGKSVFLHPCYSSSSTVGNSLTDLRILAVQNHLKFILEANGYTVHQSRESEGDLKAFLESSTIDDTSQKLEQNREGNNFKPENASVLTYNIVSRAECSGLCLRNLNNESQAYKEPGAENHSKLVTENLVLDLKQIIAENQLFIGKDGFDKNLNKVKVYENSQPTTILEDVVRFGEKLHKFSETELYGCVHIVPQSLSFRQQQIQLTWMALGQKNLLQSQLVVGPVTSKGDAGGSTEQKESAQNFYRARYEQMKEASETRYGDEADAHRVHQLTCMCVKVDLLGNAAHIPLHLDLNSQGKDAENRQGAFILYNAARLATLMEHFSKRVQTGIYQALPPVEEIDFSLLREQDDWELVYLYIAAFPDLVKQSVELIFPADGKCVAKLHTHKVTNFLVSFCKSLSAHYSRHHVLTEGDGHLLPLMYARLYLMKSAHQVLINSLHLLGVDPPSHL